GVGLHVLQDGALLVEVVHGAFFAHVGEAHGFGLEFLLAFLFQVGQAEVLEDHGGQFFHGDLGFVVVVAGVFACIFAFAFGGSWLLGDDIPDFALAVALTRVLLTARIIAEAIFVKG